MPISLVTQERWFRWAKNKGYGKTTQVAPRRNNGILTCRNSIPDPGPGGKIDNRLSFINREMHRLASVRRHSTHG